MPIWKHERVTCCVTEMNECDRRSSCTRRQKDFNESIMNKMIIRSFVQIDSIQIRSFIHIRSDWFVRSDDWFFVQIHSFTFISSFGKTSARRIARNSNFFILYDDVTNNILKSNCFCPCFTASSKYSCTSSCCSRLLAPLTALLASLVARYVRVGPSHRLPVAH